MVWVEMLEESVNQFKTWTHPPSADFTTEYDGVGQGCVGWVEQNRGCLFFSIHGFI